MKSEKEIKKNPMFLYLAVLTISSTIGLQAWLTLFNNFAVDVAGLDGNHIGVIQSLREVPGFLALLAVYIIMVLKEHRLSALSILVLGWWRSFTFWIIFSLIFPLRFEPISRRSAIRAILHPAWPWALPLITLPPFSCRPSGAFCGFWIIGFRFSAGLSWR